MQFIMLVWVKIGKKFVIIRGLSSQASCLVIEIWHNAKWIFLNHVQYMLNNTVTARNTRGEFSRSIGCSRALAEIHNSCKTNLVERSQAFILLTSSRRTGAVIWRRTMLSPLKIIESRSLGYEMQLFKD